MNNVCKEIYIFLIIHLFFAEVAALGINPCEGTELDIFLISSLEVSASLKQYSQKLSGIGIFRFTILIFQPENSIFFNRIIVLSKIPVP